MLEQRAAILRDSNARPPMPNQRQREAAVRQVTRNGVQLHPSRRLPRCSCNSTGTWAPQHAAGAANGAGDGRGGGPTKPQDTPLGFLSKSLGAQMGSV